MPSREISSGRHSRDDAERNLAPIMSPARSAYRDDGPSNSRSADRRKTNDRRDTRSSSDWSDQHQSDRSAPRHDDNRQTARTLDRAEQDRYSATKNDRYSSAQHDQNFAAQDNWNTMNKGDRGPPGKDNRNSASREERFADAKRGHHQESRLERPFSDKRKQSSQRPKNPAFGTESHQPGHFNGKIEHRDKYGGSEHPSKRSQSDGMRDNGWPSSRQSS